MTINSIIPIEFHNSSSIKYAKNYKVNKEGLYTIRIFNFQTGEHLKEFLIARIGPDKLRLFLEYFNEVQEHNVDMNSFSFTQYQNRLKMINGDGYSNGIELDIEEKEFNEYFLENESSYIRELFKEGKKVCEILRPISEEVGKKFISYRNEIEKRVTTSNLKEMIIDSTLSDIYGTTTMEGQIETKNDIEKIIKTNSYKNKLFLNEVINIKNGFTFIENNEIFPFDLHKIFSLHSVLTVGLDEKLLGNDSKQLKYNSGKFRKSKVDLGIFKTKGIDGIPAYVPPEDPTEYVKELIHYINNGSIDIAKIGLFHLIFYGIHPFGNGNKRTTRLLEGGLIQRFFDKNHLCLGMGYFFKKDFDKYMFMLSKTLGGEISVREWLFYYLESFEEMGKLSLEQSDIQQYGSIKNYLYVQRHRYYDEYDELFFRFYQKNKEKFTREELKKYIKSENLFQGYLSNSIDNRIEKHLKDEIISKGGIINSYFKLNKRIYKK